MPKFPLSWWLWIVVGGWTLGMIQAYVLGIDYVPSLIINGIYGGGIATIYLRSLRK